MKQKIWLVAAIAVAMGMLSSCMSLGASMGTSTKNKKEYQAAVGTPEDSVVFYGTFTFNDEQAFSQTNPDFPPDYQEMKNQIFISKPVAPGSQYALEYIAGKYTVNGYNVRYVYTWGHYLPLQTALNPLVINVPKEPGLYFVGSYDGYTVGYSDKKQDPERSAKYEQMCLKGALKLYKGTAWEAAIQQRIEELKNEK